MTRKENGDPFELILKPDDHGLYKLKQKNGKKVVSAPAWKIQCDARIRIEIAELREWHLIESRIEGEMVAVSLSKLFG